MELAEDARLFVELSSYGHDLAEASYALDLAVEGDDADSPTADARQFLVGFASMAYCRSFTLSKVRGALTDHLTVPDGLVAIHEHVRSFRNPTIARSRSELAVTYPIGEARRLDVQEVSAATVSGTLPRLVVDEFCVLVVTVEGLLDELLLAVRERLADQLRRVDRSAFDSDCSTSTFGDAVFG